MDFQPFNQSPPQLGNQYDDDAILRSYLRRVLPASAQHPQLARCGEKAGTAVTHAEEWLLHAMQQGQPTVEAGARRFALTLGRALELALLTEHAQWALAHEGNGRYLAAAHRFAQTHIDLIMLTDLAETAVLANDLPLPIS